MPCKGSREKKKPPECHVVIYWMPITADVSAILVELCFRRGDGCDALSFGLIHDGTGGVGFCAGRRARFRLRAELRCLRRR